MANDDQLAILSQGVNIWNKWRNENRHIDVDLSGAKLSEADLRGVNFAGIELKTADLMRAKLNEATFSGSDISGTNLIEADLIVADFRQSNLWGANLRQADIRGGQFRQADLRRTNLQEVDLSEADLTKANLSRADLSGTNLSNAYLNGSNFEMAIVSGTVFGKSDLSETLGLENVIHRGPSSISTDTFARSKGTISEVFLRGCGLPDWEIESIKLHSPGLSNDDINKILYKMYDLRASQAIQVSPLFISYSHGDAAFVDKLENQLNKRGIRFWRDIHDATAGRLEKQIDRAMRLNPTVLLILSENSTKSDWVEHEVRKARGLEKEMGRDVLCPVALDDSWKSSLWPKRIIEQVMEYNILNFSAWEDEREFNAMFRKLINGLELFYKNNK